MSDVPRAPELLTCPIIPSQTSGPYRRDLELHRADVREECVGRRLDLSLWFQVAETGEPLTGAWVEIWSADAGGRYSGFDVFRPPPGVTVTERTVPNEVVRPAETFLRGSQRTDLDGACSFTTIYPGWYASRTVHVHLVVRHGEDEVVTQLYFPEDVTNRVHERPPYRQHGRRDTVNAADGIFAGGGERTVLTLDEQPDRCHATLCLSVPISGRSMSNGGAP